MTRQKNKRNDSKMESNDSLGIPDRGDTSDISGLPSGWGGEGGGTKRKLKKKEEEKKKEGKRKKDTIKRKLNIKKRRKRKTKAKNTGAKTKRKHNSKLSGEEICQETQKFDKLTVTSLFCTGNEGRGKMKTTGFHLF